MKQRVSITDVAKKADVSIATVSNVVNNKGRVSSETVARIETVIKELGYVPSMSARNLKQKQSHLIGVIVPFLHVGTIQDNPFYWNLVSGIEAGAKDKQFHVILSGIVEGEETLSFVKQQHLDGLIVVGVGPGSSILEQVLDLNVPVVFMDSYLDDEELYEVMIDDENGGYIGAKKLLDEGFKEIAILCGDVGHSNVTMKRIAGVEKAFLDHNVDLKGLTIVEAPVSMKGGQEATRRVIESTCKAVFSFSDVAALGLIKGLNDESYHVPKDFSIVGFDDLYFTEYTIPTITTVRQDIVGKGKAAVELLMKQLSKSEEICEKKSGTASSFNRQKQCEVIKNYPFLG
ncbi:MAG: LacI family transcriptional regulator, partial [Bacillaceae bacterium]|nr:LacI family transcriptional regulator [Bacillaceae bacterium]